MSVNLIHNEDLGYGHATVLPRVSFNLDPGERVVVLGRSGSGKTTLLNAVYRRLAGNRRKIALVPQETALVPQLSVFHNVYMGQLDQHSLACNVLNLVAPSRFQRKNIEPVLCSVGLDAIAQKRVEDLSGGQKQRVAVARALFRGGDILVGDEPVTSVDETQAKSLLGELQRRFETAVIALHNVDLARQFATRIIGIQHGRVVINAPPCAVTNEALHKLYAKQRNDDAAEA